MTCDHCGSSNVGWRNCKLLCQNCKQIVLSCADLHDPYDPDQQPALWTNGNVYELTDHGVELTTPERAQEIKDAMYKRTKP